MNMVTLRIFYFCMGWVFFATGVIGAFVPVMPTTIFMILALWMFSKSSQRFHNWLFNHKVFGPPLQRWQKYRVIPPMAKCMAASMMCVSFVIVLLFTHMAWWIYATIAVTLLSVMWYILSKPSRIPHEGECLDHTATNRLIK